MTPFTDIYDRALVSMGDYKIAKLAKIDIDAYSDYMRSLLTNGIDLFVGCLQSLDYISQEETDAEDGEVHIIYYFNSDLTTKEKAILAKTVIIQWWEQKLQEVTVFQGSIPEKDFNKLEIANGLKQKSEYKDKLYQELDKLITDYQLTNLDSLTLFGGL